MDMAYVYTALCINVVRRDVPKHSVTRHYCFVMEMNEDEREEYMSTIIVWNTDGNAKYIR